MIVQLDTDLLGQRSISSVAALCWSAAPNTENRSSSQRSWKSFQESCQETSPETRVTHCSSKSESFFFFFFTVHTHSHESTQWNAGVCGGGRTFG